MKLFYFMLVLFCMNLCGVFAEIVFSNSSQTRIVGGAAINISQAPYQIALTVRSGSSYQFICGGSLISSSLVVTAAHCLEGQTTSNLRVFAGFTSINDASIYSDVNWFKIHETYGSSTASVWDDIGLIKLKSAFSLNTTSIGTITVRNTTAATGTVCTISGWGSTVSGGSASSVLMQATVPIYNKTICSSSYQSYTGVALPTGTVCAGVQAGGVDSCQGDSGGPLVCNGLLTGITSFGIGCATPGYPGVYADVNHYSNWIETNKSTTLKSSVLVFLISVAICFKYL